MQDNNDLMDEDSYAHDHDAESGNENAPGEILQKEKLIDVGNEHHHSADVNTDRPPRHDADSGSDATGTTGPGPGEENRDKPETKGEEA